MKIAPSLLPFFRTHAGRVAVAVAVAELHAESPHAFSIEAAHGFLDALERALDADTVVIAAEVRQ